MTGQFGPRQYVRGWNPSAPGGTVGGRAYARSGWPAHRGPVMTSCCRAQTSESPPQSRAEKEANDSAEVHEPERASKSRHKPVVGLIDDSTPACAFFANASWSATWSESPTSAPIWASSWAATARIAVMNTSPTLKSMIAGMSVSRYWTDLICATRCRYRWYSLSVGRCDASLTSVVSCRRSSTGLLTVIAAYASSHRGELSMPDSQP